MVGRNGISEASLDPSRSTAASWSPTNLKRMSIGLAQIKWRGIPSTDRLFFELGGAEWACNGYAPPDVTP